MSKLGAIAAVAVASIVATEAGASEIRFSSPNFDDSFQTALREAAKAHSESLGHSIQIECAPEVRRIDSPSEAIDHSIEIITSAMTPAAT